MIAALYRRRRHKVRGRNVGQTTQPGNAARRAAEDVQLIVFRNQFRQARHDGFGCGNQVRSLPQHAEMRQRVNHSAPAVERADHRDRITPLRNLTLHRRQRGLGKLGVTRLSCELAELRQEQCHAGQSCRQINAERIYEPVMLSLLHQSQPRSIVRAAQRQRLQAVANHLRRREQ